MADNMFLAIIRKRIKWIFSDSNNIFLWHESENINKKSLFPKFQLIPILQVMHDYVCFIAPIYRLGETGDNCNTGHVVTGDPTPRENDLRWLF